MTTTRLLILVLVTIILLTFVSVARAAEPAAAAPVAALAAEQRAAAQSVVAIFSRSIDGTACGNGFVVGDGSLIVTSRNVVFPRRFTGLHEGDTFVTVLSPLTPSCLSVFAGRIADTGRDPLPIMTVAVEALSSNPHAELIWASPREVLNIVQADAIGCDIITVTDDILRKLEGLGRDLDDFSLDTVKMFHDDAAKAAYTI